MKKNHSFLLQIIAFWLPLLVVTPLIIIIQNPDDFAGNLFVQTLLLICFSTLMVTITWLVLLFLPNKYSMNLIAFIAAMATVMVIQGYFIHGLFEYGQLNGKAINWKGFGFFYWLETVMFFIFLFLIYLLYRNKPKIHKNVAVVLIIFSLAQTIMVLPNYFQSKPISHEVDFDESVFEFSSTENVIHILADGFQADIVKQVFQENPTLVEEFSGFTFFENHLGRFQSTAPTIPSILTGEFFNLDLGYTHKATAKMIEDKSYTNILYENGYRLDFAPITNFHCHKNANSCLNKSFNNLKSRGYLTHKTALGGLMLLLDISLFRHTPMSIKESIYNDGTWMLSSNIPNGWSLYPDPIIREWTQHMKVATTKPLYKWYHFIGTHIPAQWDADCNFIGRQPQKREFYKAQAHCVLKGMANLLRKLKQENIYDVTTIVINGDHGCNIPANDLYGVERNRSSITDAFIGSTRPSFMIKPKHSQEALVYNKVATTLEDVAPTLLDSIGLPTDNYQGISALENIDNYTKQRNYHRYIDNTFGSGQAVPYTDYSVSGDIRDKGNWQVVGLQNRGVAPSNYEHISYDTANYFSKGLVLPKAKRHKQKSAAVYGKEFQILLRSEDQLAKQLMVQLKIPNTSPNQSFKVYVNNRLVEGNNILKPVYDKFIIQNVTIPEGFLKQGNNFFSVVFSKAGMRKSKVPISAYIKSVSLK